MDGLSKKVSSKNVLSNYKMGKTLGHGSFATVKLAEHIVTGHKVAIKILNREKIKDSSVLEKVQREIKILRFLMHPHIIRQYEVIETPEDIYFVMEYVQSGELFDYIVEKGRLLEDEGRLLFQQIISGVEYCHQNKVVHRDLKPENILLDAKSNIKIVDFGLSNVMQDGHFFKTSCGSPNYAAPEVISGKLYAGPEVDIWSCGVILYALLCGSLPFDDENIPRLFNKIKMGEYTLRDHLSYAARDLIAKMLMVDPILRISIPEIRQHPWFNNHLPHYIAVPPSQTKWIDEEVIQETVNIGFDKNELMDSLSKRIQNEATVAYYILLDNRLRVHSDNFQSKFKLISAVPFGSTRLPHMVASQVGHSSPGPVGHHRRIRLGSCGNVDKKWTLGLQSQAHPREIMGDVFKALQNLNVFWKKIGEYNMKCRWVRIQKKNILKNDCDMMVDDPGMIVDDPGMIVNECPMISPIIIKFELQLYKVSEGKYLLDVQRVEGPQFIFLDLCVAFLTKLHVI